MTIREATPSDWPAIWAMFRAVVEAGDAFPFDTDTSEAEAHDKWTSPPAAAFVADDNGTVVGTYYLRPNQPGRGNHVANAGYMVAESARGRGLASALCEHSLTAAKRLGYTAMQFNFVVCTNAAAVKTWQRCGFVIIGRVPGAFRHKELGPVDVFVMHRELDG